MTNKHRTIRLQVVQAPLCKKCERAAASRTAEPDPRPRVPAPWKLGGP